ncbi:NlpC/P60 family protein [Amycolatopsis japonica]|uniref:NlpC/P60 family protein n=1 Tax=Amycolatopsis japonica TaxID=208439 RepID=UPI003825B556
MARPRGRAAGSGTAASTTGTATYNKIGFDCGGMVLFAYAKVGISLPHNSRTQFAVGTRVPKDAGTSALRAGDLVSTALASYAMWVSTSVATR